MEIKRERNEEIKTPHLKDYSKDSFSRTFHSTNYERGRIYRQGIGMNKVTNDRGPQRSFFSV